MRSCLLPHATYDVGTTHIPTGRLTLSGSWAVQFNLGGPWIFPGAVCTMCTSWVFFFPVSVFVASISAPLSLSLLLRCLCPVVAFAGTWEYSGLSLL